MASSQNTRALRAGTYQQFQVQLHDAFAFDQPGLDAVARSGLADPRQLDDADRFRFEFWISGVMHAYDNAYYQYRVGLLDEDRWRMHLSGLRTTLTRYPGVTHWWTTTVYTMDSPEFVALVSEILGEEPERADRPQ